MPDLTLLDIAIYLIIFGITISFNFFYIKTKITNIEKQYNFRIGQQQNIHYHIPKSYIPESAPENKPLDPKLIKNINGEINEQP